ncbi:hypothetical protein S83_032961 [Arachis hypogaea]
MLVFSFYTSSINFLYVIVLQTIQQPKSKNSLPTLTKTDRKSKDSVWKGERSCGCETLNQLGGLTHHQQKVHLQGKHEELLVHLRKMQEMGLGLLLCLHANHEMGL